MPREEGAPAGGWALRLIGAISDISQRTAIGEHSIE
jgi:hypothetical protein